MCLMKHKINGNRYNIDFRRMIVDLYNTGHKVKYLSSEYGIFDVTIYSWIKSLHLLIVRIKILLYRKKWKRLNF